MPKRKSEVFCSSSSHTWMNCSRRQSLQESKGTGVALNSRQRKTWTIRSWQSGKKCPTAKPLTFRPHSTAQTNADVVFPHDFPKCPPVFACRQGGPGDVAVVRPQKLLNVSAFKPSNRLAL